MTTKLLALAFAAVLCTIFAPHAAADTFGHGANTFDIDFVTIANPGNAGDTMGYPDPAGSVAFTFRMGKHEISEQMIDTANTLGGLGITKDTRGPDKPATGVSWFEAATFVNWLNTSTGSTQAYKFDGSGNFELWQPIDAGYDPNNLFRNSLARYFLPSVHEWYKAAYYDPTSGVYYDYPTGSDTAPTAVASGTAAGTAVYNEQSGPADITLAGGLSPYDTMGQGGNVYEWEETEFDLVNDLVGSSARIFRGGDWSGVSDNLSPSRTNTGHPTVEGSDIGFRVASICEPDGIAGDYNRNGVVDGADYVVWRNGLGSTYTDGDYEVWRANFGRTDGSGSLTNVAVPESATLLILLSGMLAVVARRGAPPLRYLALRSIVARR